MKMKQLNIVIIGTGMYTCGRGTREFGTIIPAICEWGRANNLGEVSIVGTDPKGVAAAEKKIDALQKAMGTRFSLQYFPKGNKPNPKSYHEAIRRMPAPACAIIAVPDHLHRDIAGIAIKNNFHTLVVKPLAPTLKDVRGLIELQRRNHVYCAVEFHKRYDEANMMLKDAVMKGTIGDPLYFLVEYNQRKSIPSQRFKKWVAASNIFQYLGIHYVDIIYFVTGATPVRAMAIGQKNWLTSKGFDTYDSIEAMVDWKAPSGKKFVSTILTNWIDPESTSAMSDQKIKVVGTKGRFESDQKRRGITIVTDADGIKEPNPYFCSAFGPDGSVEYRGYGIDSIHRFLDDVVDIETGKVRLKDLEAKRPTFRQSLIPTSVLEAVNKSLKRNGEWVGIEI